MQATYVDNLALFPPRWLSWNQLRVKASLATRPGSLKGAGGKRVLENFPEVLNHCILTGCTQTGVNKERAQKEKRSQISVP